MAAAPRNAIGTAWPHLVTFLTSVLATWAVLYTGTISTDAEKLRVLYERVQYLEQLEFQQTAQITQLTIELAKKYEQSDILRGYLDSMPHPAWLKVVSYTPDKKPVFTIWHINDAYEREFGVQKEFYEGKCDKEVWGEKTTQEFYRNDVKTLERMVPLCATETFQVDPTDPNSPMTSRYICKWVVKFQGGIAVAGMSIDLNNPGVKR